jgi:hypothetical protein
MKEDRGSNDVEGAADFERHRDPGDDDRPTLADVDDDHCIRRDDNGDCCDCEREACGERVEDCTGVDMVFPCRCPGCVSNRRRGVR